MWTLKIQIGLALLALSCGPVLFWRRRDNIFGYQMAGVFLGTLAVPLFLSDAVDVGDPRFVRLYAEILSVGALAFLVGLALGNHLGSRSPRKIPITFAQDLSAGPVLRFVMRRARALAVVGVMSLVAAYLLLGYAPLLAADRQSAKYGVGIYRDAYVRSAPVYLFALAVAAAALPVVMALYRSRRRTVDLVLAGLLGLGLLLSLSRDLAFAGPLVFITALAIERRIRPALIVGGIAFVYLGGAIFNGVVFPVAGSRESIVDQIALSAPDVTDAIDFVEGFVLDGSNETSGRTILAGLTPQASEWDPSDYALRIRTGLDDVSPLASGGLRLPLPVWGFASFGMPGVVGFSVVSGGFVGWATGKWRRLLTPVWSGRGAALNLTVAVAVYEGTFGLLGSFYFVGTGEVLTSVVAVMLGVYVTVRVAPRAPPKAATLPEGGLGTPALSAARR